MYISPPGVTTIQTDKKIANAAKGGDLLCIYSFTQVQVVLRSGLHTYNVERVLFHCMYTAENLQVAHFYNLG